MISVDVGCDVDVYFVSEVQGSSGRDAMNYALIHWHANGLGKVHEANRSRVCSLINDVIEDKPIYIFLSQWFFFASFLLNKIFGVLKGLAGYLGCDSKFYFF